MSSPESRVKSAKAVLTFSPDVELPLRHRCRNPRCRGKLPAPVVNERDAFCCRGCFTGYFRSRCIVCERTFGRKREDQTTCGRPKCQRALRLYPEQFLRKWGQVAQVKVNGSETLINQASKPVSGTDRPWHRIAGPPMSPQVLRLATIGVDRVVQLEREQKVLVEAYLHHPDQARAAKREAAYVAAVKRFRDHGEGKPVAAPAFQISAICDWEPAPNIDPAGVPVIPEFLQREVRR